MFKCSAFSKNCRIRWELPHRGSSVESRQHYRASPSRYCVCLNAGRISQADAQVVLPVQDFFLFIPFLIKQLINWMKFRFTNIKSVFLSCELQWAVLSYWLSRCSNFFLKNFQDRWTNVASLGAWSLILKVHGFNQLQRWTLFSSLGTVLKEKRGRAEEEKKRKRRKWQERESNLRRQCLASLPRS